MMLHMPSLCLSIALILLVPTHPQDTKKADSGAKAEQPDKAERKTTGKAATAPEKLDDFLARVAKKIRGAEAPETLKSFRAKVAANVRAQGQTMKLDVAIDFLSPAYLKTTIKEGGKTYQRGRGKGLVPWQRDGDAPAYWLEGKERAKDRRSVARDLAIASGMTRFLYPDRVLKGLDDTHGPIAEELPWRRNEKVPAFRVEGIAKDGSDFPLASNPGFEGPMKIRAWFGRESLALIAILFEPLHDDKKRSLGRLEELRFLEHVSKDGLMLPKKILLRIEDVRARRMRTAQSVELINFRANPLVLTKDWFKKPE